MNHELPNKTLIVVAGPTASGKTAAAIELAKHYNTEIVSADSRQFYREMSIGTAKPTDEELAAVKHYFINSHSVTKPFSVGDYEKECLALLDSLFKTHDQVILVGGSGLFIKAITEGFDDVPAANEEIRERLNNQLALYGLKALQERLDFVDPEYYREVDLNNPQRVIRALEVFEGTGKPFSTFRKSTINKRPFAVIKFALNIERKNLYQRINNRVDVMIQQGLIEEARLLLKYRHLNALNTVGYSELFDYFDGKTDLPAAVALIKQNTRRFAKRQITWFKKEDGILWVDAGKSSLAADMLSVIKGD